MSPERWRTARPLARLREGRTDWYSIKNLAGAGAPTLIYIYDEVGYFGVTAQDFIRDLSAVPGDIELHLSTPGGEVFDGVAIYGALKQRPGNVAVVIDSLAASIGSVIAMAASPGQLSIMPNASIMIHDGFGLCIGNASDMREQAELLDRVSDNIASIYADRTGKPKDAWRTAMLAETWYIGQEAVDAGLADRLAAAGTTTPDPDTVVSGADPDGQPEQHPEPAMAATFDLSLFRRTPASVQGLRNHAATPAPTETGGPTAPDPPPPAPLPEAPAATDRGFPVAAVSGGDRSPEFGPPQEGQVMDLEWTSPNAGDELLTFLRNQIRVQGTQPPKAAAEGPGTPFEPSPYEREDDETVECPGCEKYNSPDARYCDQCGMKLLGRDDVSETGDGAAREASAKADTRRVLGIESMPLLNAAIPIHHTPTVDTPWDGPAAVAAMPAEYADLHYCHAWQSADADSSSHTAGDDDEDDRKGAFKFPHHAKKDGPANVPACRNGLARLEGSSIPDADKPGVKAHLQAHLDDAGKDDGDSGDAKNHTHTHVGFTWDPGMTAAFKEAMQ